jgi:hypothetical protein
MNVTPTAGIAATWSAAKTSPNDQAAQASSRQATTGQAQEATEPKKGPPAPEGQGTRVDVRV